ncbi:Malonyl-CoA O-methyltransferase BioC [Alcaligenes faecalis]|nr:SAM-dependent methyltransferase [Alcaligenes faecalis]CAJ0909851.1 malonyl-CoA O-methyltransferase [Alcaligenes faecalis subsp. faecalis]GAU74122.1 methyltransferase [Alcaligenes faecalis subsp. faecalis NBRC 13111]AYZ90346.1 methyltransferase domain-containing protein [Alcaligenes faecalis]QQC33832.1 methyltransferase domain-containing protein [Alcaligenes faecalis]
MPLIHASNVRATMSQLPSLPINSAHVEQQFNRRAPLDHAQFLYGEVAQRMLSRLALVRLQPTHILDAGCGASHALEPLRSRYPDMNYTGLDRSAKLLDIARERYQSKPSLWQKLRNQPTPAANWIQADMANSGLPAESQELVWSNMALHWHPEPHRVLAEWNRLLKPETLVMFSCLGPGSFAELRSAMEQADLGTRTLEFVDMHDFGDLLLENGFADPVMDQEVVTLTYRSAEKLLDDLRLLGGNPHPQRKASLSTLPWRQRLLNALEKQRHMDGTLHLSLEIAYGHAWRARSRRSTQGEVSVPISTISRRPKPQE